VDRLLLVARALSLGHRAGDAVPADLERLRTLTGEDDGTPGASDPQWRRLIARAVRSFDRAAAARLLGRSAARGVRAHLADLDALFEETGAGWAAGRLDIAHEHFLTEVAGDLLRAERLPLETGAEGPVLMLATLPGELHSLGLQAVALQAAAAGVPVRVLGAQTPPEEIVRTALAAPTLAVGVSFSAGADRAAAAQALAFLARALPPPVEVWAGGPGADGLPGLPPRVLLVTGPARLEEELARLARRVDS
jgi:methylmalonyl-CoA mutase cobalamin-binding subunit